MANMVYDQMELFLMGVFGGMILGGWYEIFRTLRLCFTHKERVVHMEDMIFCFSAGIGIFYLFQRYNDGVIRFYILVGIELGALIYFFLFCTPVQGILCLIWKGMHVLTVQIGSIVLIPAKIIVKSVSKSLKKAGRTFRIIKNRK